MNMRFTENSSSVETLKYNLKSLTKYVNCYNREKDANYKKDLTSDKKPSNIGINLRPGVSFNSLSTQKNNAQYGNINYGAKTTIRFGVELEYMLPLNNNTWAVLLEPTYRYYNSKITTYSITNYPTTHIVNYPSIEIPLGIRRYLYLNDKSKLFINTSLVFDFGLNTELKTETSAQGLNMRSGLNVAIGAGYKYGDKWSFETRYYTPRDILINHIERNSQFKAFSLIVGYTLF